MLHAADLGGTNNTAAMADGNAELDVPRDARWDPRAAKAGVVAGEPVNRGAQEGVLGHTELFSRVGRRTVTVPVAWAAANHRRYWPGEGSGWTAHFLRTLDCAESAQLALGLLVRPFNRLTERGTAEPMG